MARERERAGGRGREIETERERERDREREREIERERETDVRWLPGCLDVVFIFDVTKKAGRGFEFSWVFAYACELLSSGAAAAGRSGEREPVHPRSGRSGESGSVRPPLACFGVMFASLADTCLGCILDVQ